MTSLSIGQVAAYRSLTRCGNEELAIHTRSVTPSGGILFARKPNDEEKQIARESVVDLLSQFPEPITVLTMPGLKWKFETLLLRSREDDDLYHSVGPTRTKFVCVENDRAIYHSAMLRFPGISNPNQLLRVLPPTTFAERAVASLFIDRYYFGNVEDLMNERSFEFDAAWLDFTGPMSLRRVRLIRNFFDASIKNVLVVTAMRARWNRETSEAVGRSGGHSTWLRAALPGFVLHEIEYQDGPSPMTQYAIWKD